MDVVSNADAEMEIQRGKCWKMLATLYSKRRLCKHSQKSIPIAFYIIRLFVVEIVCPNS